MRRLPPLGSIQAFVSVAKLGSVKAAADRLSLSPPALTRRIQALEAFVGTPLFERQHNSVRLNRRGESFLVEIGPRVDALSLAIERVSTTATEMRVRIAVPSLFAAQRLVPALPSLKRRHPDLHIDLDTGANRLSRLGDGVDAAIAITAGVDEKLHARLLERSRIVAVGSRAFQQGSQAAIRPSDLSRAPILLHRDISDAFHTWCRVAGLEIFEPASVSYFDAGQLILDAAAEGLGVAFMFESHLSCSSD